MTLQTGYSGFDSISYKLLLLLWFYSGQALFADSYGSYISSQNSFPNHGQAHDIASISVILHLSFLEHTGTLLTA